MGSHIVNGKFQSDKYPTCPAGKVPLSVEDPMAQDLLWQYAIRRASVDREFAADLQECLRAAGFPSKEQRRFVHKNGMRGCYFPSSDLCVFESGQRGTGKPDDVTWLD
jgi:hypothetical protein